MAKKTKKRQREERLWWRRQPWPAIVLSIDPGKAAGAALFVPGRAPRIEEVDIYTDRVEELIEDGGQLASDLRLPFVLAMEEWGRGGPLGIDQWIGLGEARGAWRRAFLMYCNEHTEREGRIDLFSKSRVMLVPQSRWRSVVVPETGVETDVMGWRPFDSEEWKEAAKRAILAHFPELDVDAAPNGAEAACQGLYALRSDELGALLSASFLASHGLTYPQQPPGPRPRMKRRRGA